MLVQEGLRQLKEGQVSTQGPAGPTLAMQMAQAAAPQVAQGGAPSEPSMAPPPLGQEPEGEVANVAQNAGLGAAIQGQQQQQAQQAMMQMAQQQQQAQQQPAMMASGGIAGLAADNMRGFKEGGVLGFNAGAVVPPAGLTPETILAAAAQAATPAATPAATAPAATAVPSIEELNKMTPEARKAAMAERLAARNAATEALSKAGGTAAAAAESPGILRLLGRGAVKALGPLGLLTETMGTSDRDIETLNKNPENNKEFDLFGIAAKDKALKQKRISAELDAERAKNQKEADANQTNEYLTRLGITPAQGGRGAPPGTAMGEPIPSSTPPTPPVPPKPVVAPRPTGEVGAPRPAALEVSSVPTAAEQYKAMEALVGQEANPDLVKSREAFERANMLRRAQPEPGQTALQALLDAQQARARLSEQDEAGAGGRGLAALFQGMMGRNEGASVAAHNEREKQRRRLDIAETLADKEKESTLRDIQAARATGNAEKEAEGYKSLATITQEAAKIRTQRLVAAMQLGGHEMDAKAKLETAKLERATQVQIEGMKQRHAVALKALPDFAQTEIKNAVATLRAKNPALDELAAYETVFAIYHPEKVSASGNQDQRSRAKLVDFMKSWDEKNTLMYGKDKAKLDAARKAAVKGAAEVLGIDMPTNTTGGPNRIKLGEL